MFALRVICLLLGGLLGFAAAAKQMSLEGIPSCAITCMAQALPQTTCSPIDQACLCVDPEFNAAVAPCIKSTCTIKESLVVTNATWSQCEFPYSNQTAKIHWTSSIITIVAVVFMAMRFAARAAKLSPWGAGDTVIVIAFAFVICFYTELFFFVNAGLGKDIWTLHDYEITHFLKLLFVLEFFYFFGLATIKASILFFFLTIFPDRRFRGIIWAVQIVNMLVCLSFVILCFTQCQPFTHFWNGWDGEHKGKCVDLNKIGLTHVAFNITLDIVMLILPVTQIYKLQMNRKKKAGVMAMFLVGAFLTVVSVLRIKALIVFATSLNITADSVNVVLWAYIEVVVGVIVACMPNAWQLLKTLQSKVVKLSSTLGSHIGSSSSHTGPGSREHGEKSKKSSFTDSTPAPSETGRQDSSLAFAEGEIRISN